LFSFTDFKLTLGTLKVTDDGTSARVSFDSTEGIAHEQYDDSLLKNDIALIKLPEPVDLTAGSTWHKMCTTKTETYQYQQETFRP
jgi:Trypsin